MGSIGEKVKYVKSQTKHDGSHGCHWPGCGKSVPPAMWGCREHWFRLPKKLRDGIWMTYNPGQEVTKKPSLAYMTMAMVVQAWIKRYEEETRGED